MKFKEHGKLQKTEKSQHQRSCDPNIKTKEHNEKTNMIGSA